MTENQEINQRICRLLDNLIAITDMLNERIEEQIELTKKEDENANAFFPVKSKNKLFLFQGRWINLFENGKDFINIKYIGTKRIFMLYHYSFYGNRRSVRHLSHAIIDRNEEHLLNEKMKGRFIYADNLPLEFNKSHTKLRFHEKIFILEED